MKRTSAFSTVGQSAGKISGFTIVELAVVIVVLGVLAATSRFAYSGQ